MQLFKHMEVVLMLALGIVCASAAFGPTRHGDLAQRGETVALDTGPGLAVYADVASPMPTVHIVGRRLRTDEKRAGAN